MSSTYDLQSREDQGWLKQGYCTLKSTEQPGYITVFHQKIFGSLLMNLQLQNVWACLLNGIRLLVLTGSGVFYKGTHS